MHKLRSPAARRGPGVHLARIAAFSTALTALTVLVVADVTAAESDEPTALALIDTTDPISAAPWIAARILPDAIAPATPSLEQLAAITGEPLDKPTKPKKKRRSKLEYGHFEGY